MSELYQLNDVEIFAVGKWNGDIYTEKDLDEMVLSFEKTKDKLKPYLKLGHSATQTLLQKDGLQSAGWISSIKRNGNKLLADFKDIPEKIYQLIEKKAYKRISSEIFWNLKLEGKTYRRALKAVALLGGDTPEVTNLNDMLALYTDYEAELKIYETLEEEEIMEEINMDEKAKILELENQLKELTKSTDDSNKNIEKLLKENAELKAYSAKIETEKKENEVKNYLEGQVAKGLITPVQVDYFVALSMGSEIKTYTNKDNQKIEGNSFNLVKNIIDNGKTVINMSEKSVLESKDSTKVYSNDNKNSNDDLDKRILKYAKDNKVSYEDAYSAIGMEV